MCSTMLKWWWLSLTPCVRRVETLIEELQTMRQRLSKLKESLEFLRWIHNGYFTFTGCVEFDLKVDGDKFYLSEAAAVAVAY